MGSGTPDGSVTLEVASLEAALGRSGGGGGGGAPAAGRPQPRAPGRAIRGDDTPYGQAGGSPVKSGAAGAAAGGVGVTVHGLSFRVPAAGGRRGEEAALLSDVTACFRPNRMAALMGPSGSGKTTLLDLLAGRKTTGRATGDVLFAGAPPTRAFLRRHTGYVEQADTLLPMLSVEEMLMYTAELKRPVSEPISDKRAAVEELLEKLALAQCRSVRIGSPLAKGISGGQSKRTAIGIALITNPRVLMLDEPTSGLDSFTANEVVALVKGLAAGGVTIVATVHSPTANTFSLFDSMLILVRGRVVYSGPNGAAATGYVRGLPAAKDFPPYAPNLNDAEWLVDLFTAAERSGRADAFADAWAASDESQEARLAAASLAAGGALVPAALAGELGARRATVTPGWWGLRTLVKYRTSRNFTTGAFLGPRLADKLVTGALIASIWWGAGARSGPGDHLNVAAILFMWSVIPAFGAAAFVPSLVLERRLFVRERADGLYTVLTYLLAKMVDEIGAALFGALLISVAVFYAVGLKGSLFAFFAAYFATICTGVGIAYTVAAASPTMDVANAALPVYVSSLLYFAGFLLRFEDIPPWWRWFSYANPLRYAWTALMVNQFGAANPRFLGSVTVLQYFGIEGQPVWGNIGVVWTFAAGFFGLSWLILSFRRLDKR